VGRGRGIYRLMGGSGRCGNVTTREEGACGREVVSRLHCHVSGSFQKHP
jgi:hypothetical protein